MNFWRGNLCLSRSRKKWTTVPRDLVSQTSELAGDKPGFEATDPKPFFDREPT